MSMWGVSVGEAFTTVPFAGLLLMDVVVGSERHSLVTSDRPLTSRHP
jgi:hypothetical protein